VDSDGRAEAAKRPTNRAVRPEDDELSREALAVSTTTADLVGWADRAGRSPAAGLPAGRARRLLAAALDVGEDALAGMTEVDVAGAVDRMRALADQYRRLASQVTVDELTGALRRGAGLAALQREIDRSRRGGEAGVVVVFVDVDGLKEVNDRDGHAAGDDLLRATVSALRDRLRSYDLIVRYGGDEFLCVLTGTTLEQARGTADALTEQVGARTDGSISTGLAELLKGDTVDSLVERADAALYAGRRQRGQTDQRAAGGARRSSRRPSPTGVSG
jgi:diguanylate cyclase (GGDEF)-like protein